MSYPDTLPYRLLRIACACALTVSGVWGCAVGVRAGLAQRLYKEAKYGHFIDTPLRIDPPADAQRVMRMCDRAQRLYDLNYYFPALASERAFGEALSAADQDSFDRSFADSEHWNKVALALHPWQIEALEIKVRLMREAGKASEAADFWRDEVLEREFWNPDRQETYVELCLMAGEETRAIEAARHLRGGELRKKVRLIEQRREALRKGAARP